MRTIEVPMLPDFRPVYDERGRLLIADSEYSNITRTIMGLGVMRCMMGPIAHAVERKVWLVSVAED